MRDEGSPSGERPPRRRRWHRWLAALVLASAAILVAGILTRRAWLGPLLVRYLVEVAREELGAELSIERVAAIELDELVLDGVRWSCEGSALRRVDEARVALRFSLRPQRVTSVSIEARGVV